jgi:hypothetical protein
LSKQAEIPSSCGKGQGLHMEQKSGNKIQLFFWQFFLEVSVFMALTVAENEYRGSPIELEQPILNRTVA